MAPRGPMPKRTEERRRRNVEPMPVDRVEVGEPVAQPPLLRPLHPVAQAWYDALAESGQSRFYEPSDWAVAQVLAESLDAYLREPTAALLTAILHGSTSLLATEGDRRRMRLELVRTAAAAVEPARPGRPVVERADDPRRLWAVDDGPAV